MSCSGISLIVMIVCVCVSARDWNSAADVGLDIIAPYYKWALTSSSLWGELTAQPACCKYVNARLDANAPECKSITSNGRVPECVEHIL